MDESMMEAPQSGMIRDAEAPSTGRSELVKQKIDQVKEAKKHWSKDFERMRSNMDLASGKQWPGQSKDDDRYRVNILQRVIKNAVASLYAKNPKVIARRRKMLDFQVWDGKPESAQQAVMMFQQAQAVGLPPDPASGAILQDIAAGVERRAMLDKLCATLEILAQYYMAEQEPDFKTQMKQMIRRARTTGVGYVEIGFQRQMDLSPDQQARIADMAERLAVIGRLSADLQDGEIDPNGPEAEQLRAAVAGIQSEPEMIVREGLVFTFPQSTRLIPSPETQKLVGWLGAEWIAKEIVITPERVKEVYGIDLGKSFTSYKPEVGKPTTASRRPMKDGGDGGMACIWEVYDKPTGLLYVVADGYPDFLKEPAPPPVMVEQFFPFFAITFNETEDESRLFPDSDVENLKSIQLEYNRSKEALRQHRIANRPVYLAAAGQFDEGEQKSLAGHAPHDVIEVKAFKDGTKPEDLIAPLKKAGVDPNLYETESLFNDMLRVTGVQEANLGGTSGSTATESTIAQSSMQGSIGLDSDDLDEMLSRLMRAAGQIMLTELSEETVKTIAGPGAVWPTLTRHEIMAEVSLEIKAGSSGRPNKAQDAATFERMYPLFLQVPGVNPRWLLERALRIADDDTDLEDAFIDGLPSITAMNSAKQIATGNPEDDPNSQGDKGGDKSSTPKPGGTAQPGFTQGAQPNQVPV